MGAEIKPSGPKPHRHGSSIARLVARGLLVAIPMFGLFAAHAFLSEATYETSASLVLTPLPGQGPNLPAPLLMLRELQDAALDQPTLEKLARDKVGNAPAEERDEAAHRIRKAFSIDTKDGRIYTVTYRETDPRRAQAVCNLLASRALSQATRAVPPPQKPGSVASPRELLVGEMLALLEKHPQLSSPGVAPAGSGAPTEGNDPVLAALVAERANLEAILLRIAKAPSASDNPYGDGAAQQDKKQVEARLASVNAAITGRKQAPTKPADSEAKVDPAVKAEWLRLLRAIPLAPAAAPPLPAAPRFTAKLEAAPIPDTPVKPDRPRVLLIGTLVGLASGIIFVVGRAKVSSPRSERRPAPRGNSTPAPGPVRTNPMLPAGPSPGLLPPANVAGGGPALPAYGYSMDSRGPNAQRPGHGANGPPERTPPAPAVDAQRARPIVEIEAVGTEVETTVLPNVAPEDMKRPPRKVTQILGSPPSVPGARARVVEGGTGYSYVNAGANAAGAEVPFPQRAARPSSVPPAPLNHPSSPPYGASEPPPHHRVPITSMPPPVSWRPERSLDVSAREALCREILATHGAGSLVIGVTGPDSEVKSRASAELGLAFSYLRRVLLLEADFQLPALHRWMQLEVALTTGYSHQLRAHIHESDEAPWRVVECSPNLHVLAEGVLRSPGMILSREFEDSVVALRSIYDVIVINGPATNADVDLRAFAVVTDGVVLVGARPDAPQPSALRAKRIFSVLER